MAGQHTTKSTEPAAIQQSMVAYITGRTIASAKPAVLQFIGGRLQLIRVDPKTHEPVATVFDVEPKDISKAQGTGAALTIIVDGQRYIVSAVNYKTGTSSSREPGGPEVAFKRIMTSWIELLADEGVAVKNVNVNNNKLLFILVGIIVIGILVVILGIIFTPGCLTAQQC